MAHGSIKHRAINTWVYHRGITDIFITYSSSAYFAFFRQHFTTCLHITFIMLDSSSIFLAENMYITLLFSFTSYRCKITLTTKECLHVGRVVNITCCWFEYYVEKEFSGSRGTLSYLLYIKHQEDCFVTAHEKQFTVAILWLTEDVMHIFSTIKGTKQGILV